jgi:SAM-dependent methyltransferase
MRKTYRAHKGNRQYWQDRWDAVGVDSGELNIAHYPGKYADPLIAATDGPILEAGCGSGRVLLHYARQGLPIVGMDFILSALGFIRKAQADIPVVCADATRLPFADESFGLVLAFGLYHNFEDGVVEGLREATRVLKPGGKLCASFRADNVQTRITDWLANRSMRGERMVFHKANYDRRELLSLYREAGFMNTRIAPVENMPFLYKFRCFRHADHKRFREKAAREEGYRLSPSGAVLQSALMGLFPEKFCNIFVVVGEKG